MLFTILSCFGIIFLLTLLSSFLSYYFKEKKIGLTYIDGILLGIEIVLTIFFIIFTRYKCYYLLEEDGFSFYKYTSKKYYLYKDIAYIDELKSRKEKKVYLYFYDSNDRILASDNKNTLLKQLQLRCDNTLSRIDFVRKFPNKKLNDEVK